MTTKPQATRNEKPKTPRREIRYEGETVIVPLTSRDGGTHEARVDAADFARLMEDGVSPNWSWSRQGTGRGNMVRVRDGRRGSVNVARLILQPTGKQKVTFLGEGLEAHKDLTRNNITTAPKRRSRALPSSARNKGGRRNPTWLQLREQMYAARLIVDDLFAALVAEHAGRWEVSGVDRKTATAELAKRFKLTPTGALPRWPKAPKGTDPKVFARR